MSAPPQGVPKLGHGTSPVPYWVVPLTAFDVAGTAYLCDWQPVERFTALWVPVFNDGAGTLTVTVEVSWDGSVVGSGDYSPAAFTVEPGTCVWSQHGIDLAIPHLRVRVEGTSSGRWGIRGVSR